MPLTYPHRFAPTVAIVFFFIACCPVVEAALVITVEGNTISADQAGYVNIYISGNGDGLNLANYTFGISSVSGPASTLEFSATQLLNENLAGNYVFYDDLDLSGLSIYDQSNSELEQGDTTLSFDDVTITTPRLLARLELQHLLSFGQTPAQAAGETFEITLLSRPGTFFENAGGNIDTNATNAFSAASFNPGTITVSASAVPEPSSLLLFAAGGVAFWGKRRSERNRKKRLTQPSHPCECPSNGG